MTSDNPQDTAAGDSPRHAASARGASARGALRNPPSQTPLGQRFTEFMLQSNALKFGDFTLKSGRRSPYFINAGAFDDGRKIATLGAFYAEKISQSITEGKLPSRIDTVFGPAYKGIPLAVSTSIALASMQGMNVGYTFDRKEPKDHGDGGIMVGSPLKDGMKVLLVDDVMTAGTAVREVVPKIKAEADVQIVGLVLSVDRMEKTKDCDLSAVDAVEREFGFPVISIANVREIFDSAKRMVTLDGSRLLTDDVVSAADEYLAKYGA
ncbi:orotate phosphoribosyltransferase [Bifidobacterium bombi DSM 19703]|uniref:Orotate phosphoribosyltransferase n=2 Tax=Bifidobacterium bombi TaxID=471511 RepID=A0A080N202_9BIFI|nr:orotate phosphoribosyltransferase [Bifidobacterium bombi DSM 19703]